MITVPMRFLMKMNENDKYSKNNIVVHYHDIISWSLHIRVKIYALQEHDENNITKNWNKTFIPVRS